MKRAMHGAPAEALRQALEALAGLSFWISWTSDPDLAPEPVVSARCMRDPAKALRKAARLLDEAADRADPPPETARRTATPVSGPSQDDASGGDAGQRAADARDPQQQQPEAEPNPSRAGARRPERAVSRASVHPSTEIRMNHIAPPPEPAIRDIPLCQLALAPENVRKTLPDEAAAKQLIASIKSHGLLENLVARADDPAEDGAERYAVVAGGRRLAALKALAEDGTLDADHPVPCKIAANGNAGELSLAENVVRIAMHPADQVVAFNLESLYAKTALRQFYMALHRGAIEGWSLADFEEATGLKLVHEGTLKEDLPPMSRFLNRLLALPIAEQNQLFAALETRIESNIEQAMEAGSYEVGVETVRADSLSTAGRETLYEHPRTGAMTDLVEIVRRDRLEPTTANAALDIGARDPGPDGKPSLVVNARSKRAAVLLAAPSRMFDDGGVQERTRLVRPATRETMARAELDASNWRRADEATWRALWEHEIAELPTHRESRFWLAAGLLLPIWDRLPFENMRVRRLTTDAGEALIGRVLDAEQVRTVRTSFGLGGDFAMTGAEAFEAVMGRGTALALANGWRLARRRIMGADRVEIEGPADGDTDALKRMGCTVEIVSWRARAFAPGAHVLDRILERWPLAA